MVEGIIAAVVGILLGAGGHYTYEKKRVADGKTKAEKEIANAQKKASDIVLKAKDEAVELENERRKEWKPREPKITTGYLSRYRELVTSGNRGAILEIPGKQSK